MTRTLVIAITIAMAATPASAQPSAHEQAKRHFRQGKTLQDTGKYDAAVDEYKTAYDLDPRPEMLFNIAQAYRLAKHDEQALDHYRRYLAEQPDGAGAREAQQWIADIEARRPPTVAPPTEPSPEPPPPPQPRAEPPRPRTTARSSRPLRITGLATAGAGAIALGLGVKFGVDARSAADTISNHQGDWTDAERQTFAAGERANRNMVIAYTAGGALVVTGAVLSWLGARSHVVPVADARSAGLAVWGRF
jgi:tetratricopeptide (TPR) repeat protein